MNDEYEGLSIHDLHEIVATYRPDDMDDQAKGFANAGGVFKIVQEALHRHVKAISGKLNSEAAKPFLAEIEKTGNILKAAHETSVTKAGSWSGMASTARRTQEHVRKLNEEYHAAKGDAHAKHLKELLDYEKSPAKYILEHGGTPEKPDNHALRQHYDAKARKVMRSAIHDYGSDVPTVVQPPPKYRPLAVPPPDNHWTPWPGTEKHWGKHGDGGSNAVDTAGLTATSYGGNAVGGGHTAALQSVNPPGPVTANPGPGPVAPSPGGGGMPLPPSGMPPGGVPPLGRTPTPPVLRPNSSMVERPVPGRLGPTSRTPNLPSRTAGRGGLPAERENLPGRAGRTARAGVTEEENLPGRAGRTGRGLVRSQMEPEDRTGMPRRSGEVMGRRSATRGAMPEEEVESRATQRTMRPVIRGARGAGRGTAVAEAEPVDNTARGYSSRVIGAKPGRFSREFSRTPMVAKKLEHGAGGKILGKRPEPISEDRKWAKQAIAERRARRARLQKEADGLSRPVIGNGITNSAQLDTAVPEPESPEPEALWTAPTTVTGIIGQRRPMPDLDHDPGPGVITSPAEGRGEEAVAAHDPGPTAFGGRQAEPDTRNWPQ